MNEIKKFITIWNETITIASDDDGTITATVDITQTDLCDGSKFIVECEITAHQDGESHPYIERWATSDMVSCRSAVRTSVIREAIKMANDWFDVMRTMVDTAKKNHERKQAK